MMSSRNELGSFTEGYFIGDSTYYRITSNSDFLLQIRKMAKQARVDHRILTIVFLDFEATDFLGYGRRPKVTELCLLAVTEMNC